MLTLVINQGNFPCVIPQPHISPKDRLHVGKLLSDQFSNKNYPG